MYPGCIKKKLKLCPLKIVSLIFTPFSWGGRRSETPLLTLNSHAFLTVIISLEAPLSFQSKLKGFFPKQTLFSKLLKNLSTRILQKCYATLSISFMEFHLYFLNNRKNKLRKRFLSSLIVQKYLYEKHSSVYQHLHCQL